MKHKQNFHAFEKNMRQIDELQENEKHSGRENADRMAGKWKHGTRGKGRVVEFELTSGNAGKAEKSSFERDEWIGDETIQAGIAYFEASHAERKPKKIPMSRQKLG